MTPTEIARVFGVKRIGTSRKYRARCPAHGSKGLTLSITDMGRGETRIVCFAGCEQRDILKAAGLTWKDLKPGGEIDPVLKGRLADERKLERLKRRHALLLWVSSMEPEKSRYWEAAIRGVKSDMETLYWKVMPDKERFDAMRRFEEKDYRNKRLDYLGVKGKP